MCFEHIVFFQVTTNVTSQPVNTEGKASFTVTSVSGTKSVSQFVLQTQHYYNTIIIMFYFMSGYPIAPLGATIS